MSNASNTYRGCLITTSADLLGQALLTVYRPRRHSPGAVQHQQQARRAIDQANPKQLTAQGVLPFSDGAQLGPLFS
jgi:hypothetical protein